MTVDALEIYLVPLDKEQLEEVLKTWKGYLKAVVEKIAAKEAENLTADGAAKASSLPGADAAPGRPRRRRRPPAQGDRCVQGEGRRRGPDGEVPRGRDGHASEPERRPGALVHGEGLDHSRRPAASRRG